MKPFYLMFALAALALANLAAANPAPADTAGADPKPPTVTDDHNGPQPEVTIVQKGDNRIEEYRLNGKLYMVKVTPAIGAPYYLVDNDGSGNLHQVDPSQRVVIPRWVLLRF